MQGDESAPSALEESIALYRKIDPADKRDFSDALNLLAAFRFGEDPVAARALSDESIGICRGQGPQANWELAQALFWNGHFAYLQEDDAAAQLRAEESQLLLRQTGDVWEAAAPVSTLGHLAVRRGDFTAARACYAESLRLWREGEDEWGIAKGTDWLGDFDRIEGNYAAAGARYEESLHFWRDSGDKEYSGLGLCNLGIALLMQGDYEQAERLLVESFPLIRDLGDDLSLARNLAGLAMAAKRQGQELRAARLLGAAEALGTSTFLWGITQIADQTDYDRLVSAGRAEMQGAAFAAAWAEGQAMDLEQAVMVALEVDSAGDGTPSLLP
jgi:non-specific serine/threonine protein kinase